MRRRLLAVFPIVLCLAAASSPAQLVLEDVALTAGVDDMTYGRASAMVDLDRDGLVDLIAASGGERDLFYRQLPDHSFQLMNDLWGTPTSPLESWVLLVADFDNDGDPDVYVVTGGFLLEQPNQLLRNDLTTSGVFTDVSAVSGDAKLSSLAFGATALDYDRDGDLDVLVSNNRRIDGIGGCNLLRNDGGLVFTDVSAEAGVDIPGDYRHCSMGDYDNDGWPDIGVGGMAMPSLLLHNNGDGTFTDMAASAGVDIPSRNFGMVFDDFNNDGWLDIFLPKYQSQVGPPEDNSGLFVNNQDGTFNDVTDTSGITGQEDMGHNAGDLDADGFPEIFVGTGNPFAPDVDKLFRITPSGHDALVAEDISDTSGIHADGPTRTHGMAFGDYDDDGDVDLFVSTGGMGQVTATNERNRLFRNQGNDNNWLKVSPRGIFSSRTPAGLRAVARLSSGEEVYRMLTVGKGFGNTDIPELHFGLGDATAVDELAFLWPSGIEQIVLAPALGARTEVVETGLRLDGAATVGGDASLQLAGPPDYAVAILVGLEAVHVKKPAFGGYLELVPIGGSFTVTLDGDGRFDLPFTIPRDPALHGVTFYVQTWTRPGRAKGGGSLSTRLTVVIE